jgi:hypothetical protein
MKDDIPYFETGFVIEGLLDTVLPKTSSTQLLNNNFAVS